MWNQEFGVAVALLRKAVKEMAKAYKTDCRRCNGWLQKSILTRLLCSGGYQPPSPYLQKTMAADCRHCGNSFYSYPVAAAISRHISIRNFRHFPRNSCIRNAEGVSSATPNSNYILQTPLFSSSSRRFLRRMRLIWRSNSPLSIRSHSRYCSSVGTVQE